MMGPGKVTKHLSIGGTPKHRLVDLVLCHQVAMEADQQPYFVNHPSRTELVSGIQHIRPPLVDDFPHGAKNLLLSLRAAPRSGVPECPLISVRLVPGTAEAQRSGL